MAKREEQFEGIIDYDKIDTIIEDHYGRFAKSQIKPIRQKETALTLEDNDVFSSVRRQSTNKPDNVNQLFLFSGGSATTVGALVKETQKNGAFANSVFKIDSELVAKWDIIRNLQSDATLTKHAEKLLPLDILRHNSIVTRLADAEEGFLENQRPPYQTTRTHDLHIPLFGKVAIPEGYVFSDFDGKMFLSGDSHQKAFQATLRYMAQKVFEVAKKHEINTTLVIDDHLEDLETVKNLVDTAKAHESETMYVVSYVKPEVAIERAAQRFRHEGEGQDIAFRINRMMQIRTHLHQVRNWDEIPKFVDGAILTHRNIEGQRPVIIQRKKLGEDGQVLERTGENKAIWLNSFRNIGKLNPDPMKALYELGFQPSTSPFGRFAEGVAGGQKTPLQQLEAETKSLDGWTIAS